nr:extracellular solute-binding protein [Saccharofermentans sp.]
GRKYTSRLEVADCTEDSILLCGSYMPSNIFSSIDIVDFVIIELTKAEKNPHEGKTILELYIPKYDMNGVISDSIIKYNETNKKYFIQIADRYNDYDYSSEGDLLGQGDINDAAILEDNNNLSYGLAMDIMNGEGPDILMDTSGIAQLNNDNYLVDLSSLVSELGPENYYSSIIDGARTDGKLYQMPVCYTIKGIQTDKENAGASGAGFTTDEYERFLHDTLNGKDIIESSQAYYFALLFNNMSDSFIKDGKVDLTGDDFEKLAKFVKDNVQQNVILPDVEVNVDEIFDSSLAAKNVKAIYCNCPGISGYLVKRASVRNGTSILGVPSSDGRGPMFGTNVSVAVSANAVNKDACIEFVKLLLTDEIQYEFAVSDYFVLNRNALRQSCNEAVRYYNGAGADDIFDYMIGCSVSIEIKFTDEDIDNLENIILSCSKSDCIDSAINMILIEEMPAYFSGQKDLTSVISVLQDRIQKILDERR